MTIPTPTTRTIKVDDEVHDVLQRTATSRGTDINGALHYLLEVPKVSASPSAAANDDDDDDE
ncbi:hypothetical protein [Polymorphospora rubra]|uniref:hypothetical protein n=1 Tax=Polymorphospora rubra TaxID=338584 RepID=UPI001BB35F8E|nr:hypothetical protein [Polymorphospora rubra]